MKSTRIMQNFEQEKHSSPGVQKGHLLFVSFMIKKAYKVGGGCSPEKPVATRKSVNWQCLFCIFVFFGFLVFDLFFCFLACDFGV